MNHNRDHFQKVHNAKIDANEIYQQLNNTNMRDKILDR